jgi:hypothetical protein
MILKIINNTKIEIKKLALPFSMSSMMDAHNSKKHSFLL